MSRQLPPNPHLDVLRKQAKTLLSDHQSGEAEAVNRVSAVIDELPPVATQNFSLRQAQQVLAREYGFSSWQALADRVQGASGDDWAVDRYVFYQNLATDLADSYRVGNTSTYGVLGDEMTRRMHPGGEALTEARGAISWLAGCLDWAELGRAARGAIDGGGIDRELFSALEHMHDGFAERIAERVGASARVAFVDYTTVCEFLISLGRPSRSFRCSAQGVEGSFVIDLGPQLAQGLADDGAGVAEHLLADLMSLWRPMLATQNPSMQAFSDPFALQAGRLYDTCVLLAYDIEGDANGLLRLCYPEPSIASLLTALRDT